MFKGRKVNKMEKSQRQKQPPTLIPVSDQQVINNRPLGLEKVRQVEQVADIKNSDAEINIKENATSLAGERSSLEAQSFDCTNCAQLKNDFENLQLKFNGILNAQSEWEAGTMQENLGALKRDLLNKDAELRKMKEQIEEMGKKLLKEMDKRAEIQSAADAVKNEIEDLTKTLFEEANLLVAKEARENHGTQQQLQLISKQLQEATTQLQLEKAQGRELRRRIASIDQEKDDRALENLKTKQADLNPPAKLIAGISESENSDSLSIDPLLMEPFIDLKNRCAKTNMTKIHDFLFMKNTLEDDVIPCLRFGGNPKKSTTTFLDAIVGNICFLEEMSEIQIQELIERDEKNRQALQLSMSTEKQEAAETSVVVKSIFNKAMLERFTNALNLPTSTATTDEQRGCCTCGRQENYKFRFKISDIEQDTWYPICLECRRRFIAVMDFYTFVRQMRQGLFISRTADDLFLEAMTLRKTMFYARLGLKPTKL